MDDILVLAQSRWAIRRAMRTVTHWLNALRLDKHPDKTFIGRIARGFDFLGYHFWPDRLTVAAKTVQAFQDKVSRLYEQNGGSVGVPAAVETYVRRWNAWAKGGLGYVAGRSAVALQGVGAAVVGRASPRILLKAGRGL